MIDFEPVIREAPMRCKGQATLFDLDKQPPPLVVVNPKSPLRQLNEHAVVLLASRGGNWTARIVGTKVVDSATTPHIALARLLGDSYLDRRIVGDGPTNCIKCGDANAGCGFSAKGSTRVDWHCGRCAPKESIPNNKGKSNQWRR